MNLPILGKDFEIFEETGERRLPMATSVQALPKSTKVLLPVRCWVRNTGMYEMREQGIWILVKPLVL